MRDILANRYNLAGDLHSNSLRCWEGRKNDTCITVFLTDRGISGASKVTRVLEIRPISSEIIFISPFFRMSLRYGNVTRIKKISNNFFL